MPPRKERMQRLRARLCHPQEKVCWTAERQSPRQSPATSETATSISDTLGTRDPIADLGADHC